MATFSAKGAQNCLSTELRTPCSWQPLSGRSEDFQHFRSLIRYALRGEREFAYETPNLWPDCHRSHSCPAAAQDADRFDGPFVGSQLGWQQDRRTATTSAVPPTTSRVIGDGLVYGGQLGYDANLGGIVIGVEGSITGRTGSNSSAALDFETGRTVNVTGRAGFLASSNSLLYARGGYSNTRISVTNPAGASENRDGFTLGAGFERSLTDSISARIEYAYSDYGSDALPGIGGPVEIKYRRHGIITGINFRF
jgi:outer membrane immunogenic protein